MKWVKATDLTEDCIGCVIDHHPILRNKAVIAFSRNDTNGDVVLGLQDPATPEGRDYLVRASDNVMVYTAHEAQVRDIQVEIKEDLATVNAMINSGILSGKPEAIKGMRQNYINRIATHLEELEKLI